MSSILTLFQGSYGGGLVITLTGSGFDGKNTVINICGKACPIDSFVSSTQVSCVVSLKPYYFIKNY